MPKHPIYANLLSKKAQSVIGQVHEKTKPALRLLVKEGFEHRGYVDLFDAGPTVESKLSKIKSVKESINSKVIISDDIANETVFAICNTSIVDFRATFTPQVKYIKEKGITVISSEVAKALNVSEGDSIRFINLT